MTKSYTLWHKVKEPIKFDKIVGDSIYRAYFTDGSYIQFKCSAGNIFKEDFDKLKDIEFKAIKIEPDYRSIVINDKYRIGVYSYFCGDDAEDQIVSLHQPSGKSNGYIVVSQ